MTQKIIRAWHALRQFATGPGMPAGDRHRWKTARDLPDLAELTAQWLEGRIRSQPADEPYGPPDEETSQLILVLAALNRTGMLTCMSQPGLVTVAPGGDFLEQRAAVQGFADAGTVKQIQQTAEASGLMAVVHGPDQLPRGVRYDDAVVVTRVAGEDSTRAGVTLGSRHLASPWTGYGVCHPDAVAAVAASWQVTVIDLEWGRNDLLWRVLWQVMGELRVR